MMNTSLGKLPAAFTRISDDFIDNGSHGRIRGKFECWLAGLYKVHQSIPPLSLWYGSLPGTCNYALVIWSS